MRSIVLGRTGNLVEKTPPMPLTVRMLLAAFTATCQALVLPTTMRPMAWPPRAFVAFDYDHDSSLRDLLLGQSKHSDTNFEMHDWSVKEPFTPSVWKERVRQKIKASDLVIVICGESTHTATGVEVELRIAQEEQKPYFLLKGYANKSCTRPPSAKPGDKLYNWTWDNLKILVQGGR
jgi:hypothetical protein